MTTLTDLRGKVWYRLLKVIFIFFYIPYFLFLYVVIDFGGKVYHEPNLPNTIKEVLKDPEFYKLDDFEMKSVIESVEVEPWIEYKETNKVVLFNDLSYEEKNEIIKVLMKRPVPTTPLKNKYHYTSYYTWNITNCILYGLILTICYFLVMEFIRRGFYYVVIGKVFPKK